MVLRRDTQLLAREAICDARTARKFLEGGRFATLIQLRLEQAARKLNLTPHTKEETDHDHDDPRPPDDVA